MSNLLTRSVLLLNASWSPIGTISLKNAITMAYSKYENNEPKALIVDPTTFQRMTWSDWTKLKAVATDEVIRSANLEIKIPEILVLSRFEKIPMPKNNFSRRTLYKRDKNTCQYCLKKFNTDELTIDHIQPKSRGGKTTWENCCIACVACNSKKADKTPSEAKMKLHCVPKKPKMHSFHIDCSRKVKSWQSFIGEAYWLIELENDNQVEE